MINEKLISGDVNVRGSKVGGIELGGEPLRSLAERTYCRVVIDSNSVAVCTHKWHPTLGVDDNYVCAIA